MSVEILESTDQIDNLEHQKQGDAEALLITFPEWPLDSDTPLGIVHGIGHAGTALIDRSGKGAFYEYGIWPTDQDKLGSVRKLELPEAEFDGSGQVTDESLEAILAIISGQYPDRSEPLQIKAAQFKNVAIDRMRGFAESQHQKTDPESPVYDPNRRSYSMFGRNCISFAEAVVGQDTSVVKQQPHIGIPWPNEVVKQYQSQPNAQRLNYHPRAKENRLDRESYVRPKIRALRGIAKAMGKTIKGKLGRS